MVHLYKALHTWTQVDLSRYRNIFLGLHISGGFIGLPLLIITLLVSDGSPRQPELINFCITWVVYSISFTLLSLSGKTLNPPHTLCFIQAAALQGITPMVAVSTFTLVFKVWRTFKDPYGRHFGPILLLITLSIPYIVFLTLLIASIAVQLQHPEILNSKNRLYCTTTGTRMISRRYTIPTFSIIFGILIIGFEIAIARRYYMSRKRIATSFPLADRSTSHGLIVRLGIFNICLFITLGASILFLIGRPTPWAYLIQAALPLTAFILFASRKDVLMTWYLRFRSLKKTPAQSSENVHGLQDVRRPSEGTEYTPIQGREVASNT